MNHDRKAGTQRALKEIVRKNIIKLRMMNSMTQQDIAELLGCDRSTYTFMETGKTNVSLYTLSILADLYHISLDSFMQTDLGIHSNYQKGHKKANPLKIGQLTKQEKNIINRIRKRNSKAEPTFDGDNR